MPFCTTRIKVGDDQIADMANYSVYEMEQFETILVEIGASSTPVQGFLKSLLFSDLFGPISLFFITANETSDEFRPVDISKIYLDLFSVRI